TGEEPYSLAILAKHVFPAEWRIKIHASDIDSKVIRFAKHGVYPHARIARTPEQYTAYLMRYLRGTDEGWGFDYDVKSMVQFRRESIFEAQVGNLDLILCRNVMIYFDDAGIARMAEKFDRSLRDGGHLIIGHSEFLRRRPETLRYERLGNVSLHTKVAAARQVA
ncbi:MAG: hypothetical protein KC616_26650, partial [Myxococcales bacterium]|nr:hypothetical protein [Myxococcales bacterium]